MFHLLGHLLTTVVLAGASVDLLHHSVVWQDYAWVIGGFSFAFLNLWRVIEISRSF